jgi:putative ABC transport system ATP-binding protein
MVIHIRNVILRYPVGQDHVTVLDIPEWCVQAGEQVAISGPSGSGKSTLLHILAGLQLPESGDVSICGQEITRLGEAARDAVRAWFISVIFQNFNLLQGYTALENVLMGMTYSGKIPDRARAAALLESVGLHHRGRHYPSQLSIGEQQRVAIARALAKKPGLILADEPTGSLDPRNTGEVVKLLQTACHEQGCTLVVVSHEVNVVNAFARHISFLQLNRAFAGEDGVACVSGRSY